MRIAWCPQHRGVMRIAFFNPPPAHFDSPCPRCQKLLQQEIRGKYEPEVSVEEEVTKAPRPLCVCCEKFKVRLPGAEYCAWCVDCPTEYCDIPARYLANVKKESM